MITGPGRVVLQSMPISKTANNLANYLPLGESSAADTVDAIGSIAKLIGK